MVPAELRGVGYPVGQLRISGDRVVLLVVCIFCVVCVWLTLSVWCSVGMRPGPCVQSYRRL